MAEYQKIEYRINREGKIIETVLNATGSSCTAATAAIEQALGHVESRDFLPEYYADDPDLPLDQNQSSTQQP
jgi:Protein of unknown function (DUF2997)